MKIKNFNGKYFSVIYSPTMLMWISAAIETIIGVVLTILKTFFVIGRILAYFLANTADKILALSSILADCAVIFYEDVKVFAADVDYQYSHIIRMLSNGLSNSINDVLSFCDGVSSSIVWTGNQTGLGLHKMTSRLNSLTVSCAIGLRESIILIGDSTWMLLTFIPNLTIFIIGRIIGIVHFGAILAINTTKTTGLTILKFSVDSISFLTSVPLQTICGLISIYLIMKYRRFLFTILRASTIFIMEFILLVASHNLLFCQNMLAFMYNVSRFMGRCRNYLPSMSLSCKPTESKSNRLAAEEDTTDNGMPGLCVICQDQLKSIVLMPCRHLCLCKGCHTQLKRYRHACPVCRQPFVQTIQVYT